MSLRNRLSYDNNDTSPISMMSNNISSNNQQQHHGFHDASDFDIPTTSTSNNISSASNSVMSTVNSNMPSHGSNNNTNHHHSHLNIDHQITWKDTFRHVFSNLPLAFFHALSLLVTFFLVFIAIADRSAMQKTWYLLLEGIMVSFFAFEITSRYVLSRSVFGSFFKNRANLIEASVCGLCVLMFLFLLFSKRGSSVASLSSSAGSKIEKNLPHSKTEVDREEAEHEFVVAVRLVAQLIRGVLYVRSVMRSRRESSSDGSGGLSLMHGTISSGSGASSVV